MIAVDMSYQMEANRVLSSWATATAEDVGNVSYFSTKIKPGYTVSPSVWGFPDYSGNIGVGSGMHENFLVKALNCTMVTLPTNAKTIWPQYEFCAAKKTGYSSAVEYHLCLSDTESTLCGLGQAAIDRNICQDCPVGTY